MWIIKNSANVLNCLSPLASLRLHVCPCSPSACILPAQPQTEPLGSVCRQKLPSDSLGLLLICVHDNSLAAFHECPQTFGLKCQMKTLFIRQQELWLKTFSISGRYLSLKMLWTKKTDVFQHFPKDFYFRRVFTLCQADHTLPHNIRAGAHIYRTMASSALAKSLSSLKISCCHATWMSARFWLHC